MAKRLLLFVVSCFASVSFAQAQCDKTIYLNLNRTGVLYSASIADPYKKYSLCKGHLAEFAILRDDSKDFKFKWFRNDSLLTETSSIIKTSEAGLYRVQIQDNDCVYEIKTVELEFVENIQINTAREQTICENIGSPYPISTETNLYLQPTLYQWQRNGVDIVGATSQSINPKNSGTYTVRATAGNCSATSAPIEVKASPDNTLQSYIALDNSNLSPLQGDTLFLCDANTYNLEALDRADWYYNDNFIGNGYKVPLKEEGTYYISQKYADNCIIKSNPIYISLGKKISPLVISPFFNAISCNTKLLFFYSGSLRGNNRLVFYDAKTDSVRAQFYNVQRTFSNWMYAEDYKIELEVGTCKSEPTYLDFTNRTVQLQSNAKSTRGKKIALCNNEGISLGVSHNIEDEVSLYKDGKAIKTKLSSTREYIKFNVSETGTYYIKITSPYCDSIIPVFSDTVEVTALPSISTLLQVEKSDCDIQSLTIQENTNYSYSWYKDNVIIPNQTAKSLAITTSQFGNYYGVIQNGLCSVATETISYTRTVEEKIIGATKICEGEKLVLESRIQEATYLWKGPDNISSNQSKLTIDKATVKNSGWYFLTTAKNNCIGTDSVYVTVSARPSLSIEYVNPVCADKDLIMTVKGKIGEYKLVYDLPGPLAGRKSIFINSENTNLYINLGKMPSTLPEPYYGYVTLESNSCNLPISLPQLSNTQDCNDVLAFMNLKEKYCYETKTILKINFPKSVPANTKFKLSVEDLNSNFNLGTTTINTVEVQLPAFSLHNAYFVIESEDGKYRAISKKVDIIGSEKPLVAAYNGTNISSSSGAVHCEGYFTKIAIRYPRGQTFQWKKDGIEIAGANSWEFAAKESGKYTVSVTELGCAAESTNSLDIKSGSIPSTTIKSVIGFESICEGSFLPIKETSGFPYDKFVWKHDGRIVSEKTKNEVFEAYKTGTYTLEASQGSCKTTTDSIFVNVSKLSQSSIYTFDNGISNKKKLYLCDSSDLTFYSQSYSIYNPDRENPINFFKRYGVSFQWKHNGKSIENATDPYSVVSNKPGKYVLQVRQGECIVNSNEIEILQQEKVSINLLSSSYGLDYELKDSISVCNDDSLSFRANSNVVIDNWDKELYKDGKLIESRTKYAGNNFYNYFRINESGAYHLKASSSLQKNCFSYSDTVIVKFANKRIILPIDTIAYCNNNNIYLAGKTIRADSFQVIFNNKIISYERHATISQPGLYYLEGIKRNGCTIVQPYLREKSIKPYVTSKRFYSLPFPDPVTSCKGNEVNLAIARISGSYTFEWYNKDKKLPFNNYSINVTESGNYFAKVKYMDCEATTNAIKVDMVDIKKTISPTDSLALCINGGFETLEASKENGYTYEWFKDNTSLEETASSLKVTQAGIYKALIQSGDCSALTSSVKVYPGTQLPTATISGDTLLNVGDTANLKLSFTSNPPFTYKLSNNQEGTSQTNTIIHPVKVEEANIFKLASVKNACGEGTVSGEAKIQVIILANEPLIGHKVVVAPVPAENYCEIIFDLPISQEVSYQLIDMKGQQLSEKNLGQVTYKKQYLNLNHLTAGEYLIRIQIGKDFVTRKLIKF